MLLESLQENRCITDLDISSNHAGQSYTHTPTQPCHMIPTQHILDGLCVTFESCFTILWFSSRHDHSYTSLKPIHLLTYFYGTFETSQHTLRSYGHANLMHAITKSSMHIAKHQHRRQQSIQ